MILDQFRRHRLTFGPSPVHHLARLSDHLAARGGGAQVWAKREDVNSGLAFGGNKIRKLEYIVPDVLASGADTLVSIGGHQSNHTREVEETGGTPYAIPAGASEHRLGGLGFANWAFEVAGQERALGVTFEVIVVRTVTGCCASTRAPPWSRPATRSAGSRATPPA